MDEPRAANSHALFDDTCDTIENCVNYRPDTENTELMSLVYDKQTGKSLHHKRESAIAIDRPVTVSCGKVYPVRIAFKGYVDGDIDGWPEWHVDDTIVLLVKHDGTCNVHAKTDVDNNDFSKPLPHLTASQFVNHTLPEDKVPEDDASPSMRM